MKLKVLCMQFLATSKTEFDPHRQGRLQAGSRPSKSAELSERAAMVPHRGHSDLSLKRGGGWRIVLLQ